MHVHLPKPLHGWRAFAGEVGIIVLGVLIAIGFERMADELHWRGQVRDARASIDRSIADGDVFFAYRVAARDCIARRLNRVSDIIERVAKHEPVPTLQNVFPDIGNGLSTNEWDISRAAQTLVHFNRDALRQYGSYYLGVDYVELFEEREAEDLGVLRVLEGDPSRLGPVDIAGLRVAVRHAAFDNDVIAPIAQRQLEISKSLGIRLPAPERSRLQEICRPLP